MKRFTFSLQAVLDVRRQAEDEKRLVHVERQHELQAAEAQLAFLHGRFERYANALRDAHNPLASDQLKNYYAHLDNLDRRIITQRAAISQHRLAADRAHTELVDAANARETIDELKDRRFEEYRALEALLEERELDEANDRRTKLEHVSSPGR